MKKNRDQITVAMAPLAVTMEQASDLSSIGRTLLYRAVKEGRLIARKSGKRTIIMRADLERFLMTLPAVSD